MSKSSFSFPYGLSFLGSSGSSPDTRSFVDPTTNQIQSGRYINPKTGDYVLGANGHLQGFSGIYTNVYLALATSYNSSSINGFGQQFSNIKMLDGSAQSLATTYATNALSNLINNNKILLLSVSVTTSTNGAAGGQLGILISWKDLTTNQNNLTTLSGGNISNLLVNL